VSRENSQGQVYLFGLEDYAIIVVTGCRGTVSHTLLERGWYDDLNG